MVRIKLEALAQPLQPGDAEASLPLRAVSSGSKLTSAVTGAMSGAVTGVTGAVTGVTSGLGKAVNVGSAGAAAAVGTGVTGVFSLGRGLRDFILRGTVVELAVAVVLGTAFTDLIAATTEDWITPMLGAIFKGSNFSELYFEINGSQFRYGHFINALLVFLIVIIILYLGVVLPLEKLQFAAYKHKAIMRDCPRCLEEISMAATRCKFCCADIEMDAEVAAALKLATTAMEAQEKKRPRCLRWVTCCVKPRAAVIKQSEGGQVQMQAVGAELLDEVGASGPSTSQNPSVKGMRLRSMSRSPATSLSPAYGSPAGWTSPASSFSESGGASGALLLPRSSRSGSRPASAPMSGRPSSSSIDIEAGTEGERKLG